MNKNDSFLCPKKQHEIRKEMGKKQGTTSYSHKTGFRSVIKSFSWKQRC